MRMLLGKHPRPGILVFVSAGRSLQLNVKGGNLIINY